MERFPEHELFLKKQRKKGKGGGGGSWWSVLPEIRLVTSQYSIMHSTIQVVENLDNCSYKDEMIISYRNYHIYFHANQHAN